MASIDVLSVSVAIPSQRPIPLPTFNNSNRKEPLKHNYCEHLIRNSALLIHIRIILSHICVIFPYQFVELLQNMNHCLQRMCKALSVLLYFSGFVRFGAVTDGEGL